MAALGSIGVSRFMPNSGTLTVKVYATRGFRFRLWLALKLFRLGGKVAGLPVELVKS